MHADIRAAKLEQVQISRTAAMSADQTSTDSYAIVPESTLDTKRHNRLLYEVEETGASNGIDAKIMGRIKDEDGNWSAWQDAAGTDASTSNLNGASAVLQPDEVLYDQHAVFIKANTGGSQGDAAVKGRSFHLDT
jgi:hypothetical protein